MSFLWRYVLVVAALMAASLLLAGCGGGEEEEGEGLEEYFRQAEEIGLTADTRADTLQAESQGVGEDLEATQEYFDALQAIGEQAVSDLRGLHPPSEARDAHDEFVAALSVDLEIFEDFNDQLADIESLSELEGLFTQFEPSFGEITDRIDEACFELQGMADENGIDVNMGCY